ncbi:MAG: IS200/IS605 family transposase [Rubrobacteraceae bacterium]
MIAATHDNLQKSAHSAYAMHYHLIFCTACRAKAITEPVGERLKDIVEELMPNFGAAPVAQETDLDHIHILFSTKPSTELTKLINSLKGVTARRIRQEFPETRKHLRGDKFWSPSYCLITTGQASIDVLKQYIDSQGRK